MSTPFFQRVHLRFGLRQKIILILVGLTTAIVLLLGLVTYGTIHRISANFHRSFDLEIAASRLLITLKEEVITRRDYLETFLLSSSAEDLGPIVVKYGELSERIEAYLMNPTATLRGRNPLGTPANRPFLEYLARRPPSSVHPLDPDSQVTGILERAQGMNREFDRTGRLLMRNHLNMILLSKNGGMIRNDIRQFFTADLRRIPAPDGDAQQVLSQVAALRGLEGAAEVLDPSYEVDVERLIAEVVAVVEPSGLGYEHRERILRYLPQFCESVLFLSGVERELQERRATHNDLFKRVTGTGSALMDLVNQADVMATRAVIASLEDNVEAQRRSLALIVFTWVGSLSLSVVLSVYVIRRITRPLVQLSMAARNTGQGVFDGEVKVEGKDEIALLAETFSQMIRRIKEQIAALKRADSMLIAQERLAAIGQLAAGIAHEIRNPLSAIKMNAQILARRSHAREADQEYWDILINEVNRLDRIVNDTLEYTQPPTLSKTWCDLHRIIEGSKEIVRQNGDGISFDERYDWTIPKLFVDEGRIKQVLLNLLINAAQSMETHKRIGIATALIRRDGERWVRIAVSDMGRGIRPEHLDRIYEPFFSTKAKGVGLGLSISKRIVEEHGGRIEVVSRTAGHLPSGAGDGWSTEFHVLLPAGEGG
jgi:signal transduction histidine kinase